MADRIWYVYGVTSGDATLVAPPPGIDDAPIDLERMGELAALVSALPASTYDAGALEERVADLDWLGPRAIAHDRVLSWASDRGAIVPFPMLTLFSDGAAVRGMLGERRETLLSGLRRAGAGREYALRVYRVDAELLRHLPELSPRLQELERAASAASPGQRYLLERKLEAERKAELRLVSQRVAGETYEALAACAEDAARSPIPQTPTDAASGIMILDAAFLVAPTRFDSFQQRLSDIVAQRDSQGFRFDFTGPWPPYHFVGEPGRER
jgi:hypothetical protein